MVIAISSESMIGYAGIRTDRSALADECFWLALAEVSPIYSPAERLLPSCYQQHNAANERHCAYDRRQQYRMCLIASSVNRSDVNDLLPGRVRKTSPRKPGQSKYNQDHPNCSNHGASFGSGSDGAI